VSNIRHTSGDLTTDENITSTVTNPIFDNWISTGNPPRIAVNIGMEMSECSADRAVMEFEAAAPHHNPTGTVHGGILCYVADTAMGFAWASRLQPGETFTTIEMKINFFRPVFTGKLSSEATVVRRGKTVGYVECEVKDTQGRLVAKSSATMMTLRGDTGANRALQGATAAAPEKVTPETVR
jgi:uncharacterized protein (TIGR00369 family)